MPVLAETKPLCPHLKIIIIMKLEMQLSAPLMAAFILGKMPNRPFRYANLSREIDNFKKMKMGKKMLVIFFK